MRIKARRFNRYFCGLALALLAGCETPGGPLKPKNLLGKELARMSFHCEMNPDGTERSVKASVFRAQPVLLTVDRSPFLHEASIESAVVVTNLDSTFQIGVELDRSGALALENISTMHRQRRIVIHCQFSDGKKVESRWIGAPVVRGRMADGIIVFTPDCTVEEAVRIVAGLNNAAAQWSGKKVKSASP